MTEKRLRDLLARFSDLSIAVVGDYFLDKYLILDPELTETSIETGLDAYQIVDIRCSPGAAGTVVSNLSALGVGKLHALSVIGRDGDGYDLKKGLELKRVDTSFLIETDEMVTPTYTKPMMREKGGEREMNRLDRRNRNPVPAHVEDQIITHLHDIVPHVQGIIVGDQLKERNFGVITDRVREAFADLGRAWPDRVILADARFHIGSFRNVLLKPNRHEAARALYPDWKGSVDIAMAEQCGRALSERCGRPVIVTLSEEGLLVIEGDSVKHIPGVRVPEPTDPVGAGDSATAGIVSSLCAGASLEEAALMGNLVASITVQQLGTTGSASPERVIHRFNEHIGWQDGTAHHG